MTNIVATAIRVGRWIKRPTNRRYLYRLANAGVGVVVIRGLIDGNEAAAWLLAINAVLGLADAHVDTSSED